MEKIKGYLLYDLGYNDTAVIMTSAKTVYTDLQDVKKEIIKKLEQSISEFIDTPKEKQENYELIENIKTTVSVYSLNYYLEDMFFIKEVIIQIK